MIFKYFILGIKFLLLSLFYLTKWFVIGVITIILIFPYYFGIEFRCLISKKERKKLGFNGSIIPTIMMILSLTTYFISIFIFTRWFVQNERIKKMGNSIIDSTVILEKEEEQINSDEINSTSSVNSNYSFSFEVDFDSLLRRNSDTVAWLRILGTNINYPVVQALDNQYYLEHDINKYPTNVGWIFGDYRSNFNDFGNNTIIYGHNLTNKTMFGSLPWTLRSSWYKNEDNHFIKMNTVNAKVVWKVFAVYKIEPVTDYLRTSFSSNSEYENWLHLMKKRSVYNFGEDVFVEDKILTLSTCDDTGNKRVVLQAKLVSVENY